MSRKARIFIVGVLVAGCALVFWHTASEEAEPVYNGIPLSHWVIARCSTQAPDRIPEWRQAIRLRSMADEAIAAQGTNAVRFLVHWISYETPKKYKILKALPLIQDTPLIRWLRKPSASELRARDLAFSAPYAFHCLGPAAFAARGDLIRLARNPTQPETAARATQALLSMGIMTMPDLREIMRASPCVEARLEAIRKIMVFGTNAGPFIPDLIHCCHDRDYRVVESSLVTLGNIKTPREVIVPAMIKVLDDPRPSVRAAALSELSLFIPDDSGAIEQAASAALKDPQTHHLAATILELIELDRAEDSKANQ